MSSEKHNSAPPHPATDSGRLVLWLVVMGIAMLFLPLWLLTNNLQEERLVLQSTVTHLREVTGATPQPDPQAETRQERLLTLREVTITLQSIQNAIIAQRVDWVAVMGALLRYDWQQIALTRVAQLDGVLSVEGSATDEAVVLAYVAELREQGIFERVQVQSIIRNETAETAQRSFDFQLSLTLIFEGDTDE